MPYNCCLHCDKILSNEIVNSRGVFKQMKDLVDLKIVRAEPGDEERVLQFLQKYFYPEEPTSICLKRLPKSVEEVKALTFIRQGLSFLAVDALEETKDNIVGVILNNEVHASDDVEYDKLIEQNKNNTYGEILKISKKLDEESNVWKRIQVEKAFHTHILAVKTSYRGLNIGKKLIERSLEKAKSSSYTHATIECSSFYSAKVVASLGFELFHEISYKDYLDENGRVVFQTQMPHEAIKKYADKAIHTCCLGISPEHRGLNIGKKLMEHSLNFAKSLNFLFATIECSSFYSAKIAADLGYESYFELLFTNYRDEKNNIIFNVKPPHTGIKFYVKKIQ